ncbi:MAG: hypothetical protein ABSF78_17010 [Candidatus Acidiferrales bacterium]
MTTERRKPRLAVITPFLDKNHGTELHVVEWITFLLDSFEIHIYSQQVEDVDLKKSHWHRIPKLPGPHLLNYMWWFCANHLWRAFDHYFRGLRYDLVFSPGINCLDADVISVHIVFAEYAGKNKEANSFSRHPVRDWPRLLHRRLYYRLLIFLEQRIYTHREITLILIARKTLKELWRFYARSYGCPVLYTGLDPERFEPQKRQRMRSVARAQIGLAEDSFAVVLVGNDWLNKGVPVLLKALALLPDSPVKLLVVSREDSAPARAMASSLGVEGRVYFLPIGKRNIGNHHERREWFNSWRSRGCRWIGGDDSASCERPGISRHAGRKCRANRAELYLGEEWPSVECALRRNPAKEGTARGA